MTLFPDLPPVAAPATAGNTRLSPEQSARRGAGQSAFAKDALNRYDTIDPRAVAVLLPHLHRRTRFIEPCAGKGDLVRQLVAAGHWCSAAFDIAPRADGIEQQDAITWHNPGNRWESQIITNPPFDWPVVSAMLANWADQVAFSWLLLEASFMHTQRAGALMQRCRKIVTIGRLKWAAESEHSSTKDYCWYQFIADSAPGTTAAFYGRGWRYPG
jgi:hypothetical protein